MAREPLANLKTSPKPERTNHNVNAASLLAKLPEEIRQTIYAHVLQGQRSQVVFVQPHLPGQPPKFHCTFVPAPVDEYLHARVENPSLRINDWRPPEKIFKVRDEQELDDHHSIRQSAPPLSPFGVLETNKVRMVMKLLLQRLWNLPQVCRTIYAETWDLAPTLCTFAFPSDLDLRLFLRELDDGSVGLVGGLCVSWRTQSSLMTKMKAVKTVYLFRWDSTPEREEEARRFYEQYSQVVMVGNRTPK